CDRAAYVAPVEQDASGGKFDSRPREQLLQLALGGGIAGIDSRSARRQRDRPIHRAGVDVLEAERACQALRDRRFARADRPVDCDYRPRALHFSPSRIARPRSNRASKRAPSPSAIARANSSKLVRNSSSAATIASRLVSTI